MVVFFLHMRFTSYIQIREKYLLRDKKKEAIANIASLITYIDFMKFLKFHPLQASYYTQLY